jgi:hypothetical protein
MVPPAGGGRRHGLAIRLTPIRWSPQRALEERGSRGEDDDKAFEHALNDLGLEIPGEEPGPADEPWRDDEPEWSAEPSDGETAHDDVGGNDGDEEHELFTAKGERHPLLADAMELLQELHTIFRNDDPRLASSLSTLFQRAGDVMGGLAQALSGRADDIDDYGLRVVQLKCALRGAAFARGALILLRPVVSAAQGDELQRRLEKLGRDIFQELTHIRFKGQAGGLPVKSC